jgi:hypothetical protein
MKYLLIFSFVLFSAITSYCQNKTSSSALPVLSDSVDIDSKALDKLDRQYDDLSKSIQKRTQSLLAHLQKKEARLKRKVQQVDSAKAAIVFANSDKKYKELKGKIDSSVNKKLAIDPLKNYDPSIDTMQTALLFIQKDSTMSPDKLLQVQSTSNQLKQVQGQIQQGTDVQTFIKEREQVLKSQLSQYGVGKELTDINKECYYYQQQMNEYKSMLKDKQKLQQKAISTVTNLPAFKSFMAQNSYLAQLFPTSANNGTSQALDGLQTNASTQQQLQSKFGLNDIPADDGSGGGPDGSAILQQEVQQAQAVLSKVKDQINAAGGGSSDMVMPNFTPNTQKTKPILGRLEFGTNMQSQRSNTLLPTITEFALTLGYKLSDKATTGIGVSYKIGWGRGGFDNISLSNQGIGLRSFIDIKAKGSIWITGGYEYNYMQEFASIHTIDNLDVWQKSALIGLTKKYKVGKKEGNLQLLYDLLASQEVPRSPAFKFRTGFTF